jgi:F-type H+-transporting ATPase subunit delta
LKASIVAKRYGTALYDVAKEAKNTEKLLEEYEAFVNICNNDNVFLNFIMNPLIKKDDKIDVFKSLKGKVFSDILYSFFNLLTKKSRLSIILEVYDVLKALYMDEKGEVEANVSVAIDVSDDVKKEIKSILNKITKKDVILNINVDPSIIGGLVVKVKSDLYDASVKGQLSKIKESLI